MSPDVRWKQRFNNFDRAFALLEDALKDVEGLSLLEKEGAIQRFEYTLDLAWKTLKDYLEYSGLVITPPTPRQVLKDAFAVKILPDGQVWIDMLDHRNALSHQYDGHMFEEAAAAVKNRYLPALKELREYLAARIGE